MKTAILFALAFTLSACAIGSPSGTNQGAAAAHPTVESLVGTEWLLEDLGGSGVLDRIQATLAFSEAGKVAGNGSCNRFAGAAEIGKGTIRFGQFATTRMACPPAVMDQETKYLKALEGAERIAMEGPYLLIYSKGIEKPLRFTRKSP